MYLTNSYNRANITSSSKTTNSAGGILGYIPIGNSDPEVYMKNVYSTGNISAHWAGMLIGEDSATLPGCPVITTDNRYYLASDTLSAIYDVDDIENTVACTQSEMKIEEFAEKLGDVFVYVNGSYPKLLWEVYENGDVNQDGIVNVADIILLQKYLLASETLSKTAATLADMDEDKCVDGFDLAYLKRAFLAK